MFRYLLCLVPALLMLAACASPHRPAVPQPPASEASISPTSVLTQVPPISTPLAPEKNLATPTQYIPAQMPPASPTFPVLPGPDCAIGLPPTRPDSEGPYFLAGSPEKASLIEPGMSGTPLTIQGYVFTVDCKWVPGTKIEFWQADANGEYDLQGYRLRGHVFTDENGHYQIETILPAAYETRPRHIHVMVIPPELPDLTTQLYFPGDAPYPELTVTLSEDTQGVMAKFNFVLVRK
jgi:hypothetical protein